MQRTSLKYAKIMRLKYIWLNCFLLINVLFLSAALGQDNGNCEFPPFVPNDLMTTPFGPAFADIVLLPRNFLPCRGGPFALCYYSGPDSGNPPLPCVLTEDGKFANCECFEFAYGTYFVDINAILNTEVYLETIEKCGVEGGGCQNTNEAPVCESINRGELIPGADSVSTFSTACVKELGLGQTNCTEPALYAGCMTAPCIRCGEEGIVNCLCPTFDGPYQVGQDDAMCNLSNDLVWSAAFNPNAGDGGKTFPTPSQCIPDAMGEIGCPLLTADIPPPPGDIDCEEVCEEYQSCQGRGGIEIGYTCDATLCTASCDDGDLVDAACSGLQNCDVTEVIKLEEEVGCSCCASQVCGCDPNNQTNQAIFDLNERQREKGITPQCDINGTLCGNKTPSGGGGSGCSVASIGTSTPVPLYLLIPFFILINRLCIIYRNN